ncbi:MAG: hypothetical protein FJ109_01450 [Deltaproteobacteria bacterium]|nr:hypothetical protein [Deltaproteobacteria bacterium]
MSRSKIVLLALAAAVTAAASLYAPTVPFDADPTAYLPPDDPAVGFWLEQTRRFGALNVMMVGIEEPGEPLRTESLERLKVITNRLEERKAEGIALARSLTNFSTLREGEDGTLHAELLMETIPQDEAARAALVDRIRADSQARGAVVSEDLKGYLILVTADARHDAREVAGLVRDIVEREKGPLDAVYYGAPFISGLLTSQIYAKLPYIIPAFLALLLVPLFLFRTGAGRSVVVLLCAGISLVWWLGLMRVTGVELTTPSSGAALLLLAVGAVALPRWLSGTGDHPWRTLLLLLAGAASFYAVSLAPLPFLAHFGLVTALGFVAIALCAVLVAHPLSGLIPVLAGAEAAGARGASRPAPPDGGFPADIGPVPDGRAFPQEGEAGAVAAARPGAGLRLVVRPVPAAILGFLLLAGGLAAAYQARFLLSPRDLFSSRDEVGASMDFLDRRFGGTDFLQISVQGDFSRPEHCARLLRLTDLLDGSDIFSDVRSLAKVLAFLNEQFGGRHRIPNDTEALGNLWFFLEGNEDIRPLVLPDRTEAMVAARIAPDVAIPPVQWVRQAEDAVEQSLRLDVTGAATRIEALARRYGVSLSPADVEAVLTPDPTSPPSARHAHADNMGYVGQAPRPLTLDPSAVSSPSAGASPPPDPFQAKALSSIHDYMQSGESPFAPTEEEWKRMAEVLASPSLGRIERLKTVVADLPGFKAMDYPPDVAQQVAEVLEEQLGNALADSRVAAQVDDLLKRAGTERGKAPGAFVSRIEGVLHDLVESPSADGSDLEITVSGFPAVMVKVEADLVHGVWWAVLVVWAAMLVLALAATRRLFGTLRAGAEAAVATALTLGIGRLAGVQIDSAAAPLYLLAPVVSFFLSPWVHGGELGRVAPMALRPGSASGSPVGLAPMDPASRCALTMALALALAPLSLLLAGVLPVMRLGLLMALALAVPAAVTYLSTRVRRS